jgi:cyclopropane-fatty-acyl-phospholipid synthase
MQNITVGHLRVLTHERTYDFPGLCNENGDASSLKSELRVVNDAFWIRLCIMGDLGFAEAYMYGDVECADLVSLFQVITPFFAHMKEMVKATGTSDISSQ